MGNIKSAVPSPQIVAGGIEFYEGDEFKVQVLLELTDQDGEPVELVSGDTAEVRILSEGDTVYTKTYTEIRDNALTLDFDAAMNALMPCGKYNLRVIVSHGGVIATVADAVIKVRR